MKLDEVVDVCVCVCIEVYCKMMSCETDSGDDHIWNDLLILFYMCFSKALFFPLIDFSSIYAMLTWLVNLQLPRVGKPKTVRHFS